MTCRVCPNCGTVLSLSADELLAFVESMQGSDWHVDSAHNGGFLVFEDYDSAAVAKYGTRSEAWAHVWRAMGCPEIPA